MQDKTQYSLSSTRHLLTMYDTYLVLSDKVLNNETTIPYGQIRSINIKSHNFFSIIFWACMTAGLSLPFMMRKRLQIDTGPTNLNLSFNMEPKDKIRAAVTYIRQRMY